MQTLKKFELFKRLQKVSKSKKKVHKAGRNAKKVPPKPKSKVQKAKKSKKKAPPPVLSDTEEELSDDEDEEESDEYEESVRRDLNEGIGSEESGNDSSDDDEESSDGHKNQFVVVSRPAKGDATAWNYIGCRFMDTENKCVYRVCSVCKYIHDYVFGYQSASGGKEIYHSGCEEVINEEWSEWLDEPKRPEKKKRARSKGSFTLVPIVEEENVSSGCRVVDDNHHNEEAGRPRRRCAEKEEGWRFGK
jgi:hypothetical protein